MNDSKTLTVAEFLAARLDEAERTARDATQGPWSWQELPPPAKYGLVGGSGRLLVVPSRTPDIYPSKYDARFVEANDPTRVLADIAAKRAIIADCAKVLDETSREVSVQAIWLAGRTLLKLAEPYADHMNYDGQRWAGEKPRAWEEWVMR